MGDMRKFAFFVRACSWTRALAMVNFIRMFSYALTMGKLIRNSNRSKNKFVIFSLLCFLIGFSISENEQHAKAQLIPIPPPVQQPKATQPDLEPSQLNNSTYYLTYNPSSYYFIIRRGKRL